jgi:hypothetical protein
MPELVISRDRHACCAVRGALVVLGGYSVLGFTTSVEMLQDGGAFVQLPPLSCGDICGAAAIAVEESDSAAGQVLLVGGRFPVGEGVVSTVQLVDLATGVCTPQPDLLHRRHLPAAARMLDGCIVCAGGIGVSDVESTAEMWGPPVQGAVDAAWTWRALPAMNEKRFGCCACVMSDGRFAVLGGWTNGALFEALIIGEDEQWQTLPPMHDTRSYFACEAVAGCVIVAGGRGRRTVEVYEEVLDRWLRLPCDLPHTSGLGATGSALL